MNRTLFLRAALAAVVLVSLPGCDREVMRDAHIHKQKMETIRYQNQMAEIAARGRWVLEQENQAAENARRMQMIHDAQALKKITKRNALIMRILYVLIPIAAAALGWYFWMKKETGIRFRILDKEERLEVERERFAAGLKAIEMLPESERQPMIERWIEANSRPALGFDGASDAQS